MIIQWVLSFMPISGHSLYADSAYRLYAFLLEQLSSEDACWLHEIGRGVVNQYLCFSKEDQRYLWTVNILSPEVASLLCPILEKIPEIQIENQHFPIIERAFFEIGPEEFVKKGRQLTQSRASLRFLTPTAFRQSGRYTIFPQEKLIVQSLIAHWNEVFPEYPLNDEDAFQVLLSGVHIVDYQLRTSRFSLKGVKIPGFVGSCILDAKLPLPLLELWNTLLLFADYSGIGIKTGLGMGGVHVQWLKQCSNKK